MRHMHCRCGRDNRDDELQQGHHHSCRPGQPEHQALALAKGSKVVAVARDQHILKVAPEQQGVDAQENQRSPYARD